MVGRRLHGGAVNVFAGRDYRAGREDRQAQAVLESWFDSGDDDEKLLFGRRRA